MRRVFCLCLAVVCLLFPALLDAMPDLGVEGLAGLTGEQRAALERGEMVLVGSVTGSETKTAFVEAAVVFDQPPDRTYELLANIEAQKHYLRDLRGVQVISRNPEEENVEFDLKVFFLTFRYRVIHKFDRKNLYFDWALDPSFDNSMRQLTGFWRFYPYRDGKTLGRYGTRLRVTVLIPEFLQNRAIKRKVPAAMGQAKKFVDSGGSYRGEP